MIESLAATRVAYDTVAVDYAELLESELAAKPLDRAILAAFAELVRAGDDGPVADLGCGPGRIAAHLHDLGLSTFGIDLSPAMVAVAGQRYPHLAFHEGSITDLDIGDDTLAGAVAWYSVIHTPPDRLPTVFAELHRVLAPGGYLLLAFQAGDERVHIDHAYGHPVSIDAWRLRPDLVVDQLGRAGFAVEARLLRQPEGVEKTQQAFLLARKASSGRFADDQLGGEDLTRGGGAG